MIIRKLQQRDGIHIDTPLQALQKLAEQGYQDVAIQSLHIINGDEYEKIVREVQSMRPRFQRLTLGAPLLSGHGDYVQLMQALRQQMPPLAATERVVFMGHGASHHAFAAYACLDHMMAVQGFPARVGVGLVAHHDLCRLQGLHGFHGHHRLRARANSDYA